jgi:hypothetical protein
MTVVPFIHDQKNDALALLAANGVSADGSQDGMLALTPFAAKKLEVRLRDYRYLTTLQPHHSAFFQNFLDFTSRLLRIVQCSPHLIPALKPMIQP